MDVAGGQGDEYNDAHRLKENPECADRHPAAGQTHLYQEVAFET